MPQRVCSWPMYFDAGSLKVHRDPRGYGAIGDRSLWGEHAEKQMTIHGFWPSLLEVVNQRLSNHPGKWVSRRVPGFTFRNPKPLVLPVDVVEGSFAISWPRSP